MHFDDDVIDLAILEKSSCRYHSIQFNTTTYENGPRASKEGRVIYGPVPPEGVRVRVRAFVKVSVGVSVKVRVVYI